MKQQTSGAKHKKKVFLLVHCIKNPNFLEDLKKRKEKPYTLYIKKMKSY